MEARGGKWSGREKNEKCNFDVRKNVGDKFLECDVIKFCDNPLLLPRKIWKSNEIIFSLFVQWKKLSHVVKSSTDGKVMRKTFFSSQTFQNVLLSKKWKEIIFSLQCSGEAERWKKLAEKKVENLFHSNCAHIQCKHIDFLKKRGEKKRNYKVNIHGEY